MEKSRWWSTCWRPNSRPVQTTTDLAGFWQRLYPQVRRELSRRYPKHAWPENPMRARMRIHAVIALVAALFLFGISFGYLEAAVVVYLRAIYDPIRQQLHPERKPNDLFPLITPQQLADRARKIARRLAIEIGREAATMLMLAGIALAAAAISRTRGRLRDRVRTLGHLLLRIS